MPRRLIMLTTESDEFAAWKLAQLQRKHAEKNRERKRLEELGEEPPEEEEVEEEELPTLPEEEEEVQQLFEAKVATSWQPWRSLSRCLHWSLHPGCRHCQTPPPCWRH